MFSVSLLSPRHCPFFGCPVFSNCLNGDEIEFLGFLGFFPGQEKVESKYESFRNIESELMYGRGVPTVVFQGLLWMLTREETNEVF